MGGLDCVILAFKNEGQMDKIQFDYNILSGVLSILRSLDAQRSHSFCVGNVTVQGLNSTCFRFSLSGQGTFEKSFVMEFNGLKAVVAALEQVATFGTYYLNLIRLRDHILFAQELKLQHDEYNSCNRLLNAARLITHFNEITAARNVNVPWIYLISDVVEKVANGLSA